MSDFTDNLPRAEEILKGFSDRVGGWDYEKGSSENENMLNLLNILVGQVERDAARINRLLLKLGQAAERL
jgi:hypothetical protein